MADVAEMADVGIDEDELDEVLDWFDDDEVDAEGVDEELGLEVLCTKAGEGSISVGETVLAVKGAKPLPASD